MRRTLCPCSAKRNFNPRQSQEARISQGAAVFCIEMLDIGRAVVRSMPSRSTAAPCDCDAPSTALVLPPLINTWPSGPGADAGASARNGNAQTFLHALRIVRVGRRWRPSLGVLKTPRLRLRDVYTAAGSRVHDDLSAARRRSVGSDGGLHLWNDIEWPMATTTSAAASMAYSPCLNARHSLCEDAIAATCACAPVCRLYDATTAWAATARPLQSRPAADAFADEDRISPTPAKGECRTRVRRARQLDGF